MQRCRGSSVRYRFHSTQTLYIQGPSPCQDLRLSPSWLLKLPASTSYKPHPHPRSAPPRKGPLYPVTPPERDSTPFGESARPSTCPRLPPARAKHSETSALAASPQQLAERNSAEAPT
ncbi:hypothetical protein IG631_03719 [Alternaria alternata]|nr:hypothetical protein IG631_03719 [Alternaria alternata]